MAADTDTIGTIERGLRETFGLVSFHRISGAISNGQLPNPITLPELAADPDPPVEGVTIYCIADNGLGKVELRALFPTGAAVAVATEP